MAPVQMIFIGMFIYGCQSYIHIYFRFISDLFQVKQLHSSLTIKFHDIVLNCILSTFSKKINNKSQNVWLTLSIFKKREILFKTKEYLLTY